MLNQNAVLSEVKNCGGVPTLFVNGEAFDSVAYMTYLEEFNEYDDFAKAGYNFFSVPVLFSGRWISNSGSLVPFKKGIFDTKGSPDFTLYDKAVEKILKSCPDAYIIPRVNISMPLWWVEENPDSVNAIEGKPLRESFYSPKWREDVSHMLREFVRYSHSFKYSKHIIGYQIAGGNTEEWFHFDLNAGYCENALHGFKAFLDEHYPEIPFKGLPDLLLLRSDQDYFNDEYLTRFLECASYTVADSIRYLASVVKEETDNTVVVGTFYGYSLEVTSPLWGTHALKLLLEDENIDFICSPNSYIGTRNPDSDWTEMYPADSVRLHGKMCFQECDIRTHKTLLLNEKDPKTDPDKILVAEVWHPRATKYQAMNEIRRSFSRQLIKGNGLWWFDMWGGWYNDPDIMKEMALFKEIYKESLKSKSRNSLSQVAVFIDESAYKYMSDRWLRNVIYNQRHELGLMGTPYDIYDIFDFERVHKKYKAIIFMSCTPTGYLQKALSICKNEALPYIMPSAQKDKFSVKELKAFLSENGVDIFCESEDIVYINESFMAIYALTPGEKSIKLSKKCKIKELIASGDEYESDTVKVNMLKGETKLFKIY